jgi:type II secretory pathway component PulF
MPFFTYKAINIEGELIKGTVEDIDETSVYDNVSSSGLHILKIQKSHSFADFYLKIIRSWGIKPGLVIEFASNLAVMLRAGLPLVTSISDIAMTNDNNALGPGFLRSTCHRAGFELFICLISARRHIPRDFYQSGFCWRGNRKAG